MHGMGHFSIGVTPIEAMTVLAVTAVLAAIVAPSFENRLRAPRLSEAASQLVTDLHQAHSEATLRNAEVRVSFTASGYSMSAATTPGSSTTSSMTSRTLDWRRGNAISSGASVVVTYNPWRGTAATSPTSVERPSNGAKSIQISINSMGRVQCAPISGSAKC